MNGHEACSCLPGYIGPPPNCRPECVINSECPSNKACINFKCGDPCIGACGISAKCDVANHNAICSCPYNLIGDPFVRCYDKPIEPVIEEDACNPDPCGLNARCEDRGSSASCTCPPNYLGNPYIECKPECQINSDCPYDKSCISQKCRDPCPGSCGANADCRVVSHNPICSCPPGYTGDPLESCRIAPPIGNSELFMSLANMSLKYLFYFTEPVETDPCDPDPCGAYSQKYEQDGHCVCSCLPGYVGVAPNCKPECIVSSDCSLTTACVEYKCINPCAGDVCGINARCQVIGHNAICQCPQGYIGDPFTRCTIRPIEPVIEEQIDPCSPSPCGPYSDCTRRNGNIAGCTCKVGYVGVPPNCRPECLINPDCSSNLACIQEKCKDPCPGTCASTARCQVISHRPTCTCPPGTRGDPYVSGCSQIPPNIPIDPCTPSPCGDNALCKRHQSSNRAATCECIQGYFGDPFLSCRPECTQNPDCPSTKICSNQKCVDPCPGLCGINAVCRVSNHVPRCDCLQGYTGNPSVSCNKIPEPVIEEIDPCDPNPCGQYSDAREQNGACICSCLPEYIGDPPNCRPECLVNAECSQNLACIDQKCKTPCAPGICGLNAECTGVNHNAICSCLPGYQGAPDAFIRCDRIPEPVVEEIDPCNPDPCGRYATCRDQNGYADCRCLPGYFGSPPNCRPECTINADCPSTLNCREYKCTDPCVGICGQNAECFVQNHNVICKCLTGYIGDPFTLCTKKPEIPRNPCIPNPCGRNAISKPSGNRCLCECEREYFGDPFTGCRRECEVHRDCASTLACENYKCINPCDRGICGINAECRVQNHNAICSCISGYFGDPFNRCDPRKYHRLATNLTTLALHVIHESKLCKALSFLVEKLS